MAFLKDNLSLYVICPIALFYIIMIIYGFVASPAPKTCIFDE